MARGQSGQHERQRSRHTPREIEQVLDLLDNDAVDPDFTVPGQTPVGTAVLVAEHVSSGSHDFVP